jgi:NADPH:quinone reductase-like Zn-dependent oxidoreductase
MKAVVQNSYGSSKALSLKDIEKPIPGDNEVLVKAIAAAVNAGDLFTMKGSPYVVRFTVGFPRPKDFILGWDIAGIVESVGKNVKRFRPGDEVYGAVTGAFAEYACAEVHSFVTKPNNLDFQEAAAVPTAAVTALQRLRDGGRITRGQKVLITGASGGVGSFAVQIAKSYGAEVAGVCSSKKVDMVRSLGAEIVYPYDKKDFTESSERFDLILDNAGKYRFSAMKKVLTSNGLILPNSGHGGMGYVLKAFILASFDQHIGKMKVADLKTNDLKVIKDLIESGTIAPVIDRTFELDETPEALEYLEKGNARGKVIILINR